MRTLLSTLVLSSTCLFLGLAAFSGTSAAQTTKAPVTVEGSWSLVGLVAEGKKVPDEILKKVMGKHTFTKDGMYEIVIEGKKIESGKYKIDTAKDPATVDLDIKEGEDKGKSQVGIFKLEGKTLTVSFAKPGAAARPKDFKGGPEVQVSTYERSK